MSLLPFSPFLWTSSTPSSRWHGLASGSSVLEAKSTGWGLKNASSQNNEAAVDG